jgi:PKD repeat protein
MAAYDGVDHVVLTYGGSASRAGGCAVVADTWSYLGGSWTNLSGTMPFPPAARDRASMTFDAAEGVVVLFGGAASGVPLNDTWIYPAELNASATSTTTNTTGTGNKSSGPPPGGTGTVGGSGPNGSGGGSTPIAPFAVGYSLSSVASTGPLTVTFVATAVGGVPPFVFSWNFGDSSARENGSTVSHRYTVAGTFVPVLTALDAKGETVVAVLASIHVAPNPSTGLGLTPATGPTAPTLAEWSIIGLAAGAAVLAGLVIALRRQENRPEQEEESSDLVYE